MKTRYDEPSIRISTIITDREHIYRWGRTHRRHERFSRRKWSPSWRYRRSVGCITATNDGLPEKPESTRLRAASPRGFEISVRTVLTCTRVHRRISFARLRQGRDLLTLFASPRGMASEAGRTELSLGTRDSASCLASNMLVQSLRATWSDTSIPMALVPIGKSKIKRAQPDSPRQVLLSHKCGSNGVNS